MTFTLDPFGQLTAGIKYVLQQALLPTALIASPAQIRAGWPDAQMVSALAVGTFNPIVSISFGKTVLSPQQPGLGSNKTLMGPVQTDGTVTLLTETMRLQTPVTICVTAGGITGKTLRAQVGSLIAIALGTQGTGVALSVHLPDTMEQATSTWSPAQALFGNQAQLVYSSESTDDRLDSREVYRFDLVYQATHSRYSVQTEVIVTGLAITQEIGVTVVPPPPPVPAPPP